MSERVKIFSYGMVASAISDNNFMANFPVFAQVKANAPKVIEVNTKCRGCVKRKTGMNIFREFLSVVSTMPPEEIKRLKLYFNVDKLLVNTKDPRTGGVICKVF